MCCVVVDSTKIPNPAAKVSLAPSPFKVTVEPPTVPFDIVMTPEPLAV